MGKASDHMTPGAVCTKCKAAPAIVLTRLVARDDGMEADGMLWAGPTCWPCAHRLAKTLDRDPHLEELRAADELERQVEFVLKDFSAKVTTVERCQLLQQAWLTYHLLRQTTPIKER